MAKLTSALGGPGDGVLRDAITIAESALAPLPPSVSTETAATLPCAALTAWTAVVEQGAVRPGSVVLTQGTGGADTLDASLRLVRPGGTIALIGVLSGAKASITLPLAVMRQVRLQGVTCGPRESLDAMIRAIAAHVGKIAIRSVGRHLGLAGGAKAQGRVVRPAGRAQSAQTGQGRGRGVGQQARPDCLGDHHHRRGCLPQNAAAMGLEVRTVVSFARHQFPPAITRHAVWLYMRFTLSYRHVKDLLAERGLSICPLSSYRSPISRTTQARTISPTDSRRTFARELRRRRPPPTSRWHLDEMAVTIAARQFWLWRAVDDEGEVLDLLVQRRRDKSAAAPLQSILRQRSERALGSSLRAFATIAPYGRGDTVPARG